MSDGTGGEGSGCAAARPVAPATAMTPIAPANSLRTHLWSFIVAPLWRLPSIRGYVQDMPPPNSWTTPMSHISYKRTTTQISQARGDSGLNHEGLTVSAVKPLLVVFRRAAVFAACLVISAGLASSASADPVPAPAPPDAAPPADGLVPSGTPATVNTPDGWTLALGAKDEMQTPVPPLTTALSSREYLASGTFTGLLNGPEEPRGVLEAGYEIGCGIDMSTSNGVTMAGGAGITPSLGASGPLGAFPTTVLPVVSTPVNGVITVGLKPGIVIVVPVDKKEFKGPNPWIMISKFHVKIDGCVGQSFIRSYATLTRSTDQSDVVLSYVGVTTTV